MPHGRHNGRHNPGWGRVPSPGLALGRPGGRVRRGRSCFGGSRHRRVGARVGAAADLTVDTKLRARHAIRLRFRTARAGAGLRRNCAAGRYCHDSSTGGGLPVFRLMVTYGRTTAWANSPPCEVRALPAGRMRTP
jgi:hypothetical protein